MIIGKANNDIEIYLDIVKKHNDNNFIYISGNSGTGKTSFVKHIAKEAEKDGIPCVIIDFSDSYRLQDMSKKFSPLININVEEIGLGINPFTTQIKFIDGKPYTENAYDIAERLTELISNCLKIKSNIQKNVLNKAILTEVKNNGENSNFKNIAELCDGNDVANKLFPLTKPNLFIQPLKWEDYIIPGVTTVFQFSDVNQHKRILFAEMLLADLWNETKKGKLETYILCLDEIQHLTFNTGSTMESMLREGRKYNLSLILSTQFIDNKNRNMRELTEQAAMKIFFKPSDSALCSTAKMIDIENYKNWMPLLQNLKRGEFIFTGNGIVKGVPKDIKAKLKFNFLG